MSQNISKEELKRLYAADQIFDEQKKIFDQSLEKHSGIILISVKLGGVFDEFLYAMGKQNKYIVEKMNNVRKSLFYSIHYQITGNMQGGIFELRYAAEEACLISYRFNPENNDEFEKKLKKVQDVTQQVNQETLDQIGKTNKEEKKKVYEYIEKKFPEHNKHIYGIKSDISRFFIHAQPLPFKFDEGIFDNEKNTVTPSLFDTQKLRNEWLNKSLALSIALGFWLVKLMIDSAEHENIISAEKVKKIKDDLTNLEKYLLHLIR